MKKKFVTEIMPLMKTFESASALCASKCKIISQIQRNKINGAYSVDDVNRAKKKVLSDMK